MTDSQSPTQPIRLACDECGAHNTDDLAQGDVCPLCSRGRLHPVGQERRRPADPGGAETAD